MAETIKGMRIGAFDYGKKRIGFAVCDEFHISISPRRTYDAESPDLWKEIKSDIEAERLGAIVVGMPVRADGERPVLADDIDKFAESLRVIAGLDIYFQDESYSSGRASKTMVAIGKKKSKRREKGALDKVAAAIILREFLQDNEG